MKIEIVKKMEGIKNQRKDDQEEIDNSALIVGLYK